MGFGWSPKGEAATWRGAGGRRGKRGRNRLRQSLCLFEERSVHLLNMHSELNVRREKNRISRVAQPQEIRAAHPPRSLHSEL